MLGGWLIKLKWKSCLTVMYNDWVIITGGVSRVVKSDNLILFLEDDLSFFNDYQIQLQEIA